MKKLQILFLTLFFSCASYTGDYNIQYLDGIQKCNTLTKSLAAKKIRYKVIKHEDDVYEIRYQENPGRTLGTPYQTPQN